MDQMKQLPCKHCGGRGPHTAHPGNHAYDPVEIPQPEIDALARMVHATETGVHLTDHELLVQLLGRIQPNHQALVRIRMRERKDTNHE